MARGSGRKAVQALQASPLPAVSVPAKSGEVVRSTVWQGPLSPGVVRREQARSVGAVCARLLEMNPAMFEASLRAGLTAKPPYSYPYLRLAAEYIDGKPEQRVSISSEQRLELVVGKAEELARSLSPAELDQLEAVVIRLAQLPPPTEQPDDGAPISEPVTSTPTVETTSSPALDAPRTNDVDVPAFLDF